VLRRADGIFAYQLAVVVDDAAMGITQVLRGADLLPSTARQILLYRLLGLREPRWAHAGLVGSAPASVSRSATGPPPCPPFARRDGTRAEVVARLCAASGLPELPGRGLADRSRRSRWTGSARGRSSWTARESGGCPARMSVVLRRVHESGILAGLAKLG